MLHSSFLLLDNEDKKRLILHRGLLLGKRRQGPFVMFLFRLDAFYIELVCNSRSRVICEYRLFVDSSMLHPYLDDITIDHLL